MQRIFQRFTLAYGRRSLDMWQGMDMQEVYADWADALQGQSLGSIQFGIDVAKTEVAEKPPTQGQFVAFCKRYKPEHNLPQIVHRLTPEQIQANKARIADIAAKLAKKKSA